MHPVGEKQQILIAQETQANQHVQTAATADFQPARELPTQHIIS